MEECTEEFWSTLQVTHLLQTPCSSVLFLLLIGQHSAESVPAAIHSRTLLRSIPLPATGLAQTSSR